MDVNRCSLVGVVEHSRKVMTICDRKLIAAAICLEGRQNLDTLYNNKQLHSVLICLSIIICLITICQLYWFPITSEVFWIYMFQGAGYEDRDSQQATFTILLPVSVVDDLSIIRYAVGKLLGKWHKTPLFPSLSYADNFSPQSSFSKTCCTTQQSRTWE